MLFLERNPELHGIDLDIYQYISANIEKVIYMRIRDLAAETHTSTASVMRFCRKIGCNGFSEFKAKLRMYLESVKKGNAMTIDETAIINFVERSMGASYQGKIQQAANLLSQKELVLFIGVGSSNILAEYGALYFSSLFSMAFRIEDPTNQPVSFFNKNIAKKLCIVALSVSGETQEVIQYISHFNLSESSIISITNSSKCTLAKLSHVNIPYYMTTEKMEGADITTQVPALYTLEYLAREVRNKLNHNQPIF
ncbi:MurR/RpiR family transcriptional regulator [Neobacillus niacini]|uniref:MurR/RpiR family transcriptional regulator n=1 Tax=Neobacillus niacini TaxID=86668 RepID=UPI0021CAE716|nr:MurR/RpiR family transcriptional regulator [Neobacillus niacini]MCM3763889.1 MurR/RpiR family transcriptional regulator [Neobacillus niacini]